MSIRHRAPALFLVLLIAPVPAQQEPYQPRPIPAHDKVPLFRDRVRAFRAFETERFGSVFDARSKLEGTLRARVREFGLERRKLIRENHGTGAEVWQKLRKQGLALHREGARDPMFLYDLASISLAAGFAQPALELAVIADEAFTKQEYPALFRFFGARRLRGLYRGMQDQEAENAAEQRVRRHFVELCCDPEITKGQEGFLLSWVSETWPFGEHEEVDATLKWLLPLLLAEENSSRWLCAFYQGIAENRTAWRARKDVFADEVEEEAWPVFFRHLRKSKQHFLQAHRLRPQHPFAAWKLISVTMALQEGIQEQRRWFDEAVRACFDHDASYRDMLWALRPRWNGSHDQMIAFGIECLETGRFETSVPWHFWKSLTDVASETESLRTVLRRPGLFAHFERYCHGLIGLGPKRVNVDYMKSLLVAAAYAAGNRKAGLKPFLELGDRFDERVFSHFEHMKGERVLAYYRKKAASLRPEQEPRTGK